MCYRQVKRQRDPRRATCMPSAQLLASSIYMGTAVGQDVLFHSRIITSLTFYINLQQLHELQVCTCTVLMTPEQYA